MLTKKHILVSVISDLISDQRVHKVCTYLHHKGYQVTLIGRQFRESLPLEKRAYRTQRISCFFRKGILQYAEFNFKLFLTLIWKQGDIFLSNDLDTLLPNYVHAQLRRKKLVYDSHEYFTGMPELQLKPFKKKLWKILEALVLPRVKYGYTVNQSIADLYKLEYGTTMKVVRNVPFCQPCKGLPEISPFPPDKFILLLQGAGINKDRGAEELVDSMQFLPQSFYLVFIGGGDVWDQLQARTKALGLTDRVLFISKIPFDRLHAYTRQAHLGISPDKPTCPNHELMLPNKVFDYVQAGVPVLASAIVEVKRIVDAYDIGLCLSDVSSHTIADAVLWIYNNKEVYNRWKQNTAKAAAEFCWEKEQQVLDEIYND